MDNEIEYTNQTDSRHLKAYGQFFTRPEVAEFMCLWACKDAKTVLDPAVGNSVFLKETRKHFPDCSLFGYEIDPAILAFFGNPANGQISNTDYLQDDWEGRYDAILCNPPYNRFQSVTNRDEILKSIHDHTGVLYSAYTNLYILFLIKSIYQMSGHGRLAYIIPTEFLNSSYGTPIKKNLLEEHLLRAVIHFEHDDELFFNATTTCCILLLDKKPKEHILFYHLSSVFQLKTLTALEESELSLRVSYQALRPEEKWRSYLYHEKQKSYANLTELSCFCRVSRGIATGANDFFCMSESGRRREQIPDSALMRCICRSADVKTPIFKEEDFTGLARAGKTVYVLDITKEPGKEVKEYILKGEAEGIHQKYLPARRHPWYAMEQRPVAPIWISSACRNGIKVVRNLANVHTLTTFHSVYVHEAYEKDTNILFCYFLTPIAQEILRANRKELGNGLEKFQPGDFNQANMLDITVLKDDDHDLISKIYKEMTDHFETGQIRQLNCIFSKYMI